MEQSLDTLLVQLQLIILAIGFFGAAVATVLAWRILNVLEDVKMLMHSRNNADALGALSRGEHAVARVLANGDAPRLQRLESLQRQIVSAQEAVNAIEIQISQYASQAEVPTQLRIDHAHHLAELRRLNREIQVV